MAKNTMKTIVKKVVMLLSLSSMAVTLNAHAKSCTQLEALPTLIELQPGVQETIQLPVSITRLAVGDPETVDIHLASKDSYVLTTKQPGVTNVSVWTRCAREPRQSTVYVLGESTSAIAAPVLPLMHNAQLSNQVQTDIRFVEVNRSKLKEVGVSLFGGPKSKNFLFGAPGIGGSVGVGQVAEAVSEGSVPLSDNGFNIVFGGGSRRVLGALKALESSGFAYTLSQPSLVSMSGQTASFLAGGEFPVPIPSSGSDSISIEYKEFGVRLNLTPTVISEQRINLKVAPEVSELDFNNGIVMDGVEVPSLSVRRTDTTVSLADGESFVISGLINTRNTSAVDKLPLLGDIPVLGALFRSSRIDSEERELLMIVTPRLVQPMAADANLPRLPGEDVRNYDPSVLDLLLFEDGSFTHNNGLSW
ncbi:MAG TPA: type II and III secretion system protein family protein [Thiopseudomonas sp.]|nr:type II and III secretion system protein family protein [Thiopseudomonas sp.]